MNGNIALVGFMGTGKTTVGQALAERLGMTFVDTDEVISQRAGMTVTEMFALLGQPAFRKVEAKAVDEASAGEGVVLAVGGGAVEGSRVRALLKERCFVVLLTADVETLVERTGGETGRPLLDCLSPDRRRERIEGLLRQRDRAYREVCHASVDSTAPVASVVEAILDVARPGTVSLSDVPPEGEGEKAC